MSLVRFTPQRAWRLVMRAMPPSLLVLWDSICETGAEPSEWPPGWGPDREPALWRVDGAFRGEGVRLTRSMGATQHRNAVRGLHPMGGRIGPVGPKCRHCRRCVRASRGRWPKCTRRQTASSATDIRLGWPACDLFEAQDGVDVPTAEQVYRGWLVRVFGRGAPS